MKNSVDEGHNEENAGTGQIFLPGTYEWMHFLDLVFLDVENGEETRSENG